MAPVVSAPHPPLSRAEALQHRGRRMVVVGYVVTMVAVVLYCVACLSGGLSADMGDLLLQNAVPFGRATLALLGLGTASWVIGSFTYLRGAMDAEVDQGQ